MPDLAGPDIDALETQVRATLAQVDADHAASARVLAQAVQNASDAMATAGNEYNDRINTALGNFTTAAAAYTNQLATGQSTLDSMTTVLNLVVDLTSAIGGIGTPQDVGLQMGNPPSNIEVLAAVNTLTGEVRQLRIDVITQLLNLNTAILNLKTAVQKIHDYAQAMQSSLPNQDSETAKAAARAELSGLFAGLNSP
ncbi:MAG: hypothetical protein ACREDR_00525 [Blastocatellia bacterium]